jgi:hypothetical protein
MPDENRYVWQPLKAAINKHHPTWQAMRLESSVGIGIPDVNLFIPGQSDWWIELKHVEQLTSKVNLGLRKEQYIWMFEGWRVGRQVALVARIKDEWHFWNHPAAWDLARYSTDWDKLAFWSVNAPTPENLIRYLYLISALEKKRKIKGKIK